MNSIRVVAPVVLSLLFVAACKGPEAEEPKAEPAAAGESATATTPVAPATDAAATGNILPLADIKLSLPGKRMVEGKQETATLVLAMNAKGEVRASGAGVPDPNQVVAVFAAAGTVSSPDGKVVFGVAADGSVTAPGPKKLVVSSEGTITVDGAEMMSIAADGTISMKGKTESARYEGPSEARRTGAVMLLLMMFSGG